MPEGSYRASTALRARFAALIAGLVPALIAVAPDAQAAFPGINGKIAYATEGIRLMTPNGLGSERIPSDYGGDEPEISPDGTRIAAVVGQSIRTYRLDGTQEQVVHGGVPFQSDRYHSPTWSPDGTKIAFGLNAVDSPLDGTWIVNADGSDAERVYTTILDDFEWSPSGNTWVYARGGIFTLPIGSTTATRISSGIYDYAPSWSPDGDEILYASEGDFETAVVIVSVDGSNPRVVVENGGGATWSPDGTKIAYYPAASCCSGFFIHDLRSGTTSETSVNVFETQIRFDWGPCPSGTDCNATPLSRHKRSVTLRLSSHLLAKGSVAGEVGYDYNCESKVRVSVQRRAGNRWKTVLTTMTRASGAYAIALPDVAGTYRAALPQVEQSRARTEICLPANSPVRAHNH